jgi:Uma2 family endonuclease
MAFLGKDLSPDNSYMSRGITDYREAVDHLPEGTTLVAQDVSWEDYERLLEELADRPAVRLTYDHGRLEIMSPRPEHEKYKRFIEKSIDALADYLDLNVEPVGSATWRKKGDATGAEADTSYYVKNADRIIGKREIDLSVDPPPDVVVEIDATNESLSKFGIYATLKVPEIWRFDVRHNQIHMYELRGNKYLGIPASRSFSVLTPKALGDFIEQSKTKGQKAAMAAFRMWLKKQ